MSFVTLNNTISKGEQDVIFAETLAAANAKVEGLTHCYAIECANHKSSRDQLAAMTKERDELRNVFLTDSVASLASQLAAKDAVIERLREACQAITDWDASEKTALPFVDDGGAGFYRRVALCDEAMRLAAESIAIPNDDSALQERLKEERFKGMIDAADWCTFDKKTRDHIYLTVEQTKKAMEEAKIREMK